MRDRDQGWLALYGVFAGGVLGFVLAHAIKLPGLCSAKDVSCTRDWVSALSGWAGGIAALAAAILTVRVLTKQIRQGREQHLELMKFEAHDRLLLVEQVGNQANMALGTVTQIHHEFDDDAIERSNEELTRHVDAAQFVLTQILDQDFPLKRSKAQGSLPPVASRAENCLREFVAICDSLLKLPAGDISDEQRGGILRAASTHLNLAHEDLKALAREMAGFRKGWIHLAS